MRKGKYSRNTDGIFLEFESFHLAIIIIIGSGSYDGCVICDLLCSISSALSGYVIKIWQHPDYKLVIEFTRN